MPRYPKRSYNEIAEVIKVTRLQLADVQQMSTEPITTDFVLDMVAAKLARLFSNDNGAFNPERFKNATK